MPSTSLDTADAAELAELLQFLADWAVSDPGRLGASLLAYVGHLAYSIAHLQQDLHRFAFLLGGNDGEHLLTVLNGVQDSHDLPLRALAVPVGRVCVAA